MAYVLHAGAAKRTGRRGALAQWHLVKLDRYQPEDDPGQRGQVGGLAGFPGLVPAARPFGVALVTTAGPGGHEVAGEGDLEGQVGGEIVKTVRGKSIRSR